MYLSPADQSARILHRVYLRSGSVGIATDLSFEDFARENHRDSAWEFVVGVVQALQHENWYNDSDVSEPVACFYTCSNLNLLQRQIAVYLSTHRNDGACEDQEVLQALLQKVGDA